MTSVDNDSAIAVSFRRILFPRPSERHKFFKIFVTDLNGDGKGGSSDSESDGGSLDRQSMELASSHSSDDEDEFDLNPNWANQVPKSRAVGESMAGQAVVNEILQKFCIAIFY